LFSELLKPLGVHFVIGEEPSRGIRATNKPSKAIETGKAGFARGLYSALSATDSKQQSRPESKNPSPIVCRSPGSSRRNALDRVGKTRHIRGSNSDLPGG